MNSISHSYNYYIFSHTVTFLFYSGELQNTFIAWFTTGESIIPLQTSCLCFAVPSFTANEITGSVGATGGFRCIMDSQKDEVLTSPVYKTLCCWEMREERQTHWKVIMDTLTSGKHSAFFIHWKETLNHSCLTVLLCL